MDIQELERFIDESAIIYPNVFIGKNVMSL